ncbi:hypothetical protein [Klebsiella quasivariicola]|nr:hypothetical protein [Klebsiella quasivariicola]
MAPGYGELYQRIDQVYFDGLPPNAEGYRVMAPLAENATATSRCHASFNR